MPRQKKFTVRDSERLVQVLIYTLLGFDSLQFSVDCPTAPVSSGQLAKIPSAHTPQLGCCVGVPVTPLSDNAWSSK